MNLVLSHQVHGNLLQQSQETDTLPSFPDPGIQGITQGLHLEGTQERLAEKMSEVGVQGRLGGTALNVSGTFFEFVLQAWRGIKGLLRKNMTYSTGGRCYGNNSGRAGK